MQTKSPRRLWAIKLIQAQPCQTPGIFYYMDNRGWAKSMDMRTLYTSRRRVREVLKMHRDVAATSGQLLPLPIHRLVRVKPSRTGALHGVVMETPWVERTLWSIKRLSAVHQGDGRPVPYYYMSETRWSPDVRDRAACKSRTHALAMLWALRRRCEDIGDTETVFKLVRITARHRMKPKGL
jgi:hypothetical protein